MKTFLFKNGSTISKIKDGNLINWVLFPGGPGLDPSYMNYFSLNLGLKGNIFNFKYGYSSSDGKNAIVEVQDDIKELLNTVPNIAVIGHSFGGMLLQSIPEIESMCKHIILLNTSPSRDWMKCVQKVQIEMNIDDSKEFDDYSALPSSEALKKLYMKWIPYYFKKVDEGHGNKYFASLEFIPNDYNILSNPFLSEFRTSFTYTNNNITCISGVDDVITPVSLYDSILVVDKIEVPGGHFPWVGNDMNNLQKVLQEIEHRIISL